MKARVSCVKLEAALSNITAGVPGDKLARLTSLGTSVVVEMRGLSIYQMRRIEAEADDGFLAWVSPERMIAALESASDEFVSMTVEDRHLRLESGRMKASLPVPSNPQDFDCGSANPPDSPSGVVVMDDFRDALAVASHHTADEQSALRAIHLNIRSDDREMDVVATDRRRFAMTTVGCRHPSAYAMVPSELSPALIKFDSAGQVRLLVDQKSVTLLSDDGVVQCQQYAGDHPDIIAVVKKSVPESGGIVMDRKPVLELVRSALRILGDPSGALVLTVSSDGVSIDSPPMSDTKLHIGSDHGHKPEIRVCVCGHYLAKYLGLIQDVSINLSCPSIRSPLLVRSVEETPKVFLLAPINPESCGLEA